MTAPAAQGDGKIIYTGPSPRGWHRLQLAAECLQRYAWKYEAPEKPGKGPPSAALAKGSLIHLALAQHYATMRAQQRAERGEAGDSPDDWCDPFTAVDLISRLEETTKYAQVALDTYEAYIKRYPYEDELQTMQIVAVEDLVSTKIKGKYLLTGRLDLAYRDLGGRLWVMDHKTTTRLTRRHRVYYGMSGQMHAYLFMARETYENVAGLRLNMIEHTGPKFERFDLMRSPFLEQKFEQSVVDIEESIERMLTSGREYDDWPKAMSELTCIHRYGECDFLDKCRHGANAMKGGNWTWGDQ
jgi:hypothetical protein